MEPIVIDNFIPIVFQKTIYELLCGEDIQWKFSKQSSDLELTKQLCKINEPTKEHIKFEHYFIQNSVIKSNFLPYVASLISAYESYTGENTRTIQIKANLLTPQGTTVLEPPHVDDCDTQSYEDGVYHGGKKTLLYYVNDGDGDTVLYNQKFYGEPVSDLTVNQLISPKRGCAVIFDANHLYSSYTPTIKRYRLIINCTFG